MKSTNNRGILNGRLLVLLFMYFLLPHWVPSTWCSRTQISIKGELPFGKLPTTRAAMDLSIQPLNHVIGTDTSPGFAGKITVDQHLPNTVLHLLNGFFQLHGAAFFYHSLNLQAALLLSWARIALSLGILRATFSEVVVRLRL